MQPRWYQSESEAAVWDYLRANPGSNPAVVLPTGSGKSPLMAMLARSAVTQWGARVYVLAHVQELIEQNADKLRQFWPEAPIGIYSSGLRRRDRWEQITFMGIQSVAGKAHLFPPADLILIDEAHRVPLKSDGIYRQFLQDCKNLNPNVRIVGLTATPYRLQGVAVPVCGPEFILNEICYEAQIPDLIRDGFLSKLVSKAGITPDLSSMHKRGGEFIEKELAAATMPLVDRTVDDILERSAGRKAGIVFCVNEEHAQAVHKRLQHHGETSAMVSAKTPKPERKRLTEQYKAGRIRWMVNINVLSEGFDAPHIDVVVMLRPTESPGLMYQQVGRGFRISPGKDDCLILDYAGNLMRLGPVDQIRVSKPRLNGTAKVVTGASKTCPSCQAIMAIGIRECECGYTFTLNPIGHHDTPSDGAVLSSDRERVIKTLKVHDIEYMRHEGKNGKPPTMRVIYDLGLRNASEWICFEHFGRARAEAVKWWMRRSPNPVPGTVNDAVTWSGHLRVPAKVIVDMTDRYPNVIGYEFDETLHAHAAQEAAGQPRDAEGAPAAGASADALLGVPDVPEWLLSHLESNSSGRRAA